LAAASGVPQPLICAIERGRRQASPPVEAALRRSLPVRPSQALAALRAEVAAAVERNRGASAWVFGSAARGEDTEGSDLDLLVRFRAGADITDLLSLEDELAELLTVAVDVIADGRQSAVARRAHAEAAPL
jgi:predicted nucleotidyltransferase